MNAKTDLEFSRRELMTSAAAQTGRRPIRSLSRPAPTRTGRQIAPAPVSTKFAADVPRCRCVCM